jgi:hypothetical protein
MSIKSQANTGTYRKVGQIIENKEVTGIINTIHLSTMFQIISHIYLTTKMAGN